MAIDVQLLARVCEAPGAPGFETRIRNLVLEELEGLADEVRVDAIGNVVALKKGKSSEKKTMAAAHMDEIGFIVTHVDKDGFLRFNPLGGFDPKTLTSQRVLVHGREELIGVMGSKPIHIMTPDERNKPPKLDDFFVDLGLPKAKVDKLVAIGDPITRERELIEMGECVNVKSLDNRASVFLLLETLRVLKKSRRKPPMISTACSRCRRKLDCGERMPRPLRSNPTSHLDSIPPLRSTRRTRSRRNNARVWEKGLRSRSWIPPSSVTTAWWSS